MTSVKLINHSSSTADWNNIIIFDGEYEKRHLEYYPKHLYKTEEPQFLLVSSTNTVNLLLSPLPQI